MTDGIGAGGNVHGIHAEIPVAAAMNDDRAAQTRCFRVHRPVGLRAKVQLHAGSREQNSAKAQIGISALQLLKRRFGVMHRQKSNAFEAGVAPQISLGEPVVVSPRRTEGVVPVDDPADALAGGGEENGIVEADLIHELEPSFGSGVVKPAVGSSGEGAGRRSGQRILNVAIERKHPAPQPASGSAIGKMTRDALAVLENMAVAIDEFWLLFHSILLCAKRCIAGLRSLVSARTTRPAVS